MSFQQWAQIIGASIVGGLIATLSQFGLEWWRARRERRYRHFDEHRDIYPVLFAATDMAYDLAVDINDRTTEHAQIAARLEAIRKELRPLRPRMKVGMPEHTRAAVDYLISGMRAIDYGMRKGKLDKDDVESVVRVLRDCGAMLDFHARWDLGHADEPPRWAWQDKRLLRLLPLRFKALYMRHRFRKLNRFMRSRGTEVLWKSLPAPASDSELRKLELAIAHLTSQMAADNSD